MLKQVWAWLVLKQVSTEAGMGLGSADVGVDLVSTEAGNGPSLC